MNGIINTFYILFKSNSEDVIKGNKAIEKSTKDTERSLKNTNEEAQKLGQSFVKSVEGLASLGGALAGFNVIKTGVNDAAAFNTQLKLMGDLTQQNAQTLKQMGQAAAAAGGSAQGALADIAGLANMAAQSGKPLGPVDDYFRAVRERLKGRSMNERQAALNRFGINDPGNRWLLSAASDEEYERRMGRASKISPLSQASVDAAWEKTEVDAELTGAKATYFTKLWDAVKNPVNAFNKFRTGATLDASGSDVGAVAGAGAVIGGSALGAGGIAKMLLGRAGFAGAANAAGIGLASTGVAAGGLLGGMAVGSWGTEKLFKNGFFDGILNHYGLTHGDLMQSLEPQLTKRMGGVNPGMDFWMGKGYTADQAAGIMANVQHESAGNPMARGDGGQAHGLFQWHPDRRKGIMGATGIDVSNATYAEQMEAAAWEMKNGRPGFDDAHYRTIGNAAEAAAYFSQKFEAPANGGMQALMRGKTALGMVSGMGPIGGGGNNTSVKIDKIEIVTQATDAKGIANEINNELYSQLSYIEANYDDGIEK